MIIFKDFMDNNQEFFCDQSFKYEVLDDFLIKVEAKMIDKPCDDLSGVNTGANASQEEEEEQLEDGQGGGKVLDMCYYHKLEESEILSGKLLKKYINQYMAAISKKLAQESPEKAKEFKDLCKDKGNKLLAKIFKEGGDDLVAYVGENFNFPEEKVGEDGKKVWDVQQGIALGVWNSDGMSLSMYLFKHGCEEEKV